MNVGTVTLSNVLQRDRLSLDGDWNVIVDPYEMGYIGILEQRNDRGFFRDHTPRHPGDRVEYDFDASPTLTVPGDWNTQDERLHYYEGTVWYRRKISVPADRASQRMYLHIGAANHTSRVFVDGDEIATHAGGFGPFAVEVTGRLGPGEHSLVIQVDNRRERDRIPAMRSDWWNFGGLTRSVDLVFVPNTFMRHAWITMAPDGRVVGGVELDGPPEPVRLQIPELGVDDVVELDSDGRFELDVTPERWHPGAPRLYDVRWACADDQIDDRVGFRTVETDGERIVVNGETTFLRGISMHAEALSGGRRSHGADDAAALFDVAEELGVNFVRLAHYQHDEHMVREADRRGILTWCELPVYWGIAFDQQHVLDNALEQLEELITRDRSRASTIFWSMANETLPGPERNAFLTALADRARLLDPTRLVSAALLTLPTADEDQHVDDQLGEVVDVVAINQYLGWYYGQRDTIPTTRWSTPFGKPVIFTEMGAGAKHGHHGTDAEIWTEEFQAAIYAAQIEMIEANRSDTGRGAVAGLSPWILKDFRAPVRVLPVIQDGYNRKGLVSEEGERKLAFEVLRRFYADIESRI
ncbi:glycoside hydrolase family 2 protein [Ilumatobacter coccineus]|uniref:Putative glycosidase n=1 Tax=Ilumatobacter coccineus (strain NBRC 103263 / KCTC 29153 / YM16-304) TaxID=1313172 RepID=A0A6C7EA51_ILUCY|nr:glycoside hydrolase family 2 TIM barrel-domain containing protein [Ilumatobacter coccineus]BAN02892.1 putative glycosidase [Ilumatobacter coccineus YM16-304]